MRQSVQLDTPDANGLTKRQSHERYIRKMADAKPEAIAKRRKELEPVEVPPQVRHLLEVFDRLDFKRKRQILTASAGGGLFAAPAMAAAVIPEPISSLELEAHLRLHRQQLTPWEVETIELMDMAFLEESAKLRG